MRVRPLTKMVWTVERDLPNLEGKVVVITGASSGLGLEASRLFVTRGCAHVVMACRNLAKAQPFAEELNSAGPGKATLLLLDTSDLDSVQEFADALTGAGVDRIDVLLLNAGIMLVPYGTVPTKSKEMPLVELHMATNHLGHFLLTNLLLPTITATPGAHIVSVSSLAANFTSKESSIDYDVVLGKNPGSYVDRNAYAYSKLANLLFVDELGRRLKAAGADTVAVACHPGYTRTSLQDELSFPTRFIEPIMRLFMSQDVKVGCLPLIMAATDRSPGIQSGAYYGPTGMFELGGPPGLGRSLPPQARDPVQAEKLWKISEDLTGAASVI